MNYIIVQQYLLFLIGIMISSELLKKENLLADVFKFISSKISSKRAVVAIVSLFGGILPIPGRVTVSAGILSNIAPICSDKKELSEQNKCKEARSKFGIIDYLSTHHYYLWSPLEKTVILPMAALGLTWGEFLEKVWFLIIITFAYIGWYIFYKMKEDDIVLNIKTNDSYNLKRLILGFLPLIISIGLLATTKIHGSIIFSILAIYYIILTKTFDIKKLIGYVNWWLVGILSIILILSVFFKSHNAEILNYINSYKDILDITTLTGLMIISSIAFISSWIMGSSGKYAGIVALLVSIYGPQYLVWFLTLEFFAYNVSPMHKCLSIGCGYFGTPIKKYFNVIILWQLILLVAASVTLFLK